MGADCGGQVTSVYLSLVGELCTDVRYRCARGARALSPNTTIGRVGTVPCTASSREEPDYKGGTWRDWAGPRPACPDPALACDPPPALDRHFSRASAHALCPVHINWRMYRTKFKHGEAIKQFQTSTGWWVRHAMRRSLQYRPTPIGNVLGHPSFPPLPQKRPSQHIPPAIRECTCEYILGSLR